MIARFICPHCHSPVDPLSLDAASSAGTLFRICPVCDEPIPQTCGEPAPPVDARGRQREAPCPPLPVEDTLP